MKRNMLAMIGAAALLAGTGPAAWAIDAKVYPATMCATMQGSPSASAIALLNDRTTGANVSCPVVKDTAQSIFKAQVWAVDANPTSNVFCVFAAWNLASTSGSGYYSTRYTSGASSAVQTLNFQSLPAFGGGAGVPTFSCHIPPKVGAVSSSLRGYRVEENE